MALWSTPEGRAAVAVGAACWVQLCLAPAAAQRAPAAVVVLALASLAALGVGALDLLQRRAVSLGLATVGFFGLCGLEASVLGASPVPRFDTAARLSAGITAAAYVALAARAVSLQAAAIPGAVTRLDEGGDTAPRGPALRGAAALCVALVAIGCAVLFPARIGAEALIDGVSVRGAERVLRGRMALTTAGGLALGVMVALSAGSAVLRSGAARTRRGTRALTYGVWAGVAWYMRAWLDAR